MRLQKHEDGPQLEELCRTNDAVVAARAAVDKRLGKVREAQESLRRDSALPLDPARDAEWAALQLELQVNLIYQCCALQQEVQSLADFKERKP